MSKVFKISFLFLLCFSLIVPSLAVAQGSEVNGVVGIQTAEINGFTISIYSDGRVAGVNNAEKLSEETIDGILLRMNFEEDEIKIMPLEMKYEVVSHGGRKTETTITEEETVYTDLNGNEHIVTAENINEIEKIMKNDIVQLYGSVDDSFSIQDSSDRQVEGIWSGYTSIIYTGKRGSEHVYGIYNYYVWDGVPNLYFHDRVALSWQYNATPTGNTFRHYRHIGNITDTTYATDVYEELSGTVWTFNIFGSGYKQNGYAREFIHISDSYTGNSGAIAGGYFHSYSTKIVDIILGFAGITWGEGAGMRKAWKQNFKIGS